MGGMRFVKKGELVYLVADAFEEAGGLRHCFSTRKGGVSRGVFSSLNLGPNRGDDAESLLKNYEILCGAIGCDSADVVLSKQVHQDEIADVTSDMRGNGLFSPNRFTGADGLVTRERGVALVTFFADCVPVLLYDPKSRVIASIHSGWRGTVLRIALRGVKKMAADYGCKPENILACIGPSIGPCCYEVGVEVASSFAHAFLAKKEKLIQKREEKIYLDLWQANNILLLEAGIKANHITIAEECTYCRGDLYFSHRRLGERRGSMIAVMELI